jgi:hypothetical protein
MLRKFLVLCTALALLSTGAAQAQSGARHAVIYKDPNCGCCQGYADHLQRHGFTVEVRNTAVLDAIKRKYDVPASLASCHTMRIGGYTVEGHVPVATLEKLLRERPKIGGISLPGMPIGTPGMPGPKSEPFVVYELGKGEPKTFNVE